MSSDESNKQNNAPSDNKTDNKSAEKLSFTWIILGVGAVLLMWVVSSWLFKG